MARAEPCLASTAISPSITLRGYCTYAVPVLDYIGQLVMPPHQLASEEQIVLARLCRALHCSCPRGAVDRMECWRLPRAPKPWTPSPTSPPADGIKDIAAHSITGIGNGNELNIQQTRRRCASSPRGPGAP